MMHFPPCFRFLPCFRNFFQTPWKIFPISQLYLFPKMFRFNPPKFLITIFSNLLQILNFPLFSLFQYISPYFAKIIIFFPHFSKFAPYFRKIYVLFSYFMCFSFPPSLTMMHLCITQCTYWTPLNETHIWLYWVCMLVSVQQCCLITKIIHGLF